jgi:hypothetical protein
MLKIILVATMDNKISGVLGQPGLKKFKTLASLSQLD